MRGLVIGLGMLFSLVTGIATVGAPVAYAAAPLTNVVATDVLNVCSGASKGSAVCKDKTSGTNNPLVGKDPVTGKEGLLLKITRIVAIAAGVAAIIILIVSGLSMITSAGDAQKFNKARNGFIYALVGLVVIVLAQAIVSFVVTKALT
jgi:hypothetical protein